MMPRVMADALYLIGFGLFFSYLMTIICVSIWGDDDD